MKQTFILVILFHFVFAGNAQNVGIGITAPISKLHVSTPELGVAIFESSSTIGSWASIKNTSAGGQEWSFISSGVSNGEGAGHLLFYRAGTKLMIHQNGNVGIGNVAPAYKLDVTGDLHVSTTAPSVSLFESNSTVGTWSALKNTSAGGQHWSFISTGSASTEGPGHLLFHNNGPVKMMIHTNGNVGIGTTTPGYKLDVVGPTRFNGDHILESNNIGGTWFYLINANATPTGWKLITMPSTASSPGAFTMFNDQNQAHFTIQQAGNVGIGTFNPQVRLHIMSDAADMSMWESSNSLGTWAHIRNTSAGGQTWSFISTGAANGEGAGHLLFYRAGNVPLMLNQNGNVGVGVNNPIHRLDVAGNIRLGSGRVYFSDRYVQLSTYINGGIAILPQQNNVGALGFNEFYWHKAHINDVYYSFLIEVSDARAKKNIQPLGHVMDKIAQLQPVRFDIDPAIHPGFKNASTEEIEQAKGTMGFTAQNIKEVFPSMVVYNEEMGVYTVRNYNQLLSVLVQGMKEQQEIIVKLQEDIKQLKSLNR